MFLQKPIMTSTQIYLDNIYKLKNAFLQADAIIIGAGAGLSTAAGFTYDGKRFMKYFSDFHEKYGITNMYAGGFYPFDSLEEYWAYWSRYIYINRYQEPLKPVYQKLYKLVKNKDYFVLTTNVDHCFQKAGFDKQRLFYSQGDYGLFQCSKACQPITYDNEKEILKSKGSGKYLLDLWRANEIVFMEAGVPKEQIVTTNLCTCCNPKLLFSHRASHGKRGNLGAFLMIKEQG